MALTREQIRARKAGMKKAGMSYSGIDDNSWGPWQEKKYQEYLRSRVNPNMPNESRLTYGYAMPLGNPAGSLAKIGSAIVAAAPIIADPKGAGEALSGAVDYVKSIFNWGNTSSEVSSSPKFVPLTSPGVMHANAAASPTDTTNTAAPPANPIDTTTVTPAPVPSNPTDTVTRRPLQGGSGRTSGGTGGGDKKPSLMEKVWEWAKKNPKKSIAIGAAAFYPTREYIIKPSLNYVGPAVGNGVSYITTGKAPFNIPLVSSDSTQLLYEGKVGTVKRPSKVTTSQDTTNTPDTIRKFIPVTTVNTIDLDSLLRATDPNLQR